MPVLRAVHSQGARPQPPSFCLGGGRQCVPRSSQLLSLGGGRRDTALAPLPPPPHPEGGRWHDLPVASAAPSSRQKTGLRAMPPQGARPRPLPPRPGSGRPHAPTSPRPPRPGGGMWYCTPCRLVGHGHGLARPKPGREEGRVGGRRHEGTGHRATSPAFHPDLPCIKAPT